MSEKKNTLESILSIPAINKADYQEEGIGDAWNAVKSVASKAGTHFSNAYNNSKVTNYLKGIQDGLTKMFDKYGPKLDKVHPYLEQDQEAIAAIDNFHEAWNKLDAVIANRTQGK